MISNLKLKFYERNCIFLNFYYDNHKKLICKIIYEQIKWTAPKPSEFSFEFRVDIDYSKQTTKKNYVRLLLWSRYSSDFDQMSFQNGKLEIEILLSANGSPLAQGKTSITFKFQMNFLCSTVCDEVLSLS